QVSVFDGVFTVVFSAEAAVKIIAMGFWGERCYLGDPWNRLDLTVVIVGIIGYIPGLGGQSVGVLRIFRVLRPLRTLSAMPVLRQVVEALLCSLPGIWNVLIVQAMFFLLFGVLGLQLWAGLMQQECRRTPAPLADGTWETFTEDPRVCTKGYGRFECSSGIDTSEDFPYCRSPDDVPTDSAWVKPEWQPEELNWGITNFDNIGTSLLTIFQCITLEGWSDVMYLVQDGFHQWLSPLFFVAVVVIGALFMVNLMFAVM
ncbi:unnamed protein product, partial [Discosporangium mesarthrocarpum]